jgi:hypothetical protein
MRDREPLLFTEVQAFRQWHARLVLAFPPLALLFLSCRQILWNKPWGTPPISNGGLIFLTVLLIGVYLRLVTVKLVTELRPHEISVGLRGLWKRRRIRLDEIRSTAVVTYHPIADFGGYGIRSGRRGLAYIARGNKAVELALTDGKRIFIGSGIADELSRRIMALRKQVKV